MNIDKKEKICQKVQLFQFSDDRGVRAKEDKKHFQC